MYRSATENEKIRFAEAVEAATAENAAPDGGIGTLSEKTLHCALKRFFEPDASCREIPVGRFYADIAKENKIIEIQTRTLFKLRAKLDEFLKDHDVTVVHPIAEKKTVSWIEADGTVGAKHKSPKKGTLHDACFELDFIRTYLTNENFHLRLVMLDVSEYRYKNGWDKSGKRGSTRCDMLPNGIIGQYYFQSPADYADFLPEGLSETFTVTDYAKAARQPRKRVYYELRVLSEVGVIERIGREKNAFVYKISAQRLQNAP